MAFDENLSATFRTGYKSGEDIISSILKRKEEEKKQKLDAYLKLAEDANIPMADRMGAVDAIQRGEPLDKYLTRLSDTETEKKFIPWMGEERYGGWKSGIEGGLIGDKIVEVVKPSEQSFIDVPKREPITAIPKLSKDVTIDNFIVAAYPHLKEFLGQTVPRDKFNEATKSYRAETAFEGRKGMQEKSLKQQEEAQKKTFEQQELLQRRMFDNQSEQQRKNTVNKFILKMDEIVNDKTGEIPESDKKVARDARSYALTRNSIPDYLIAPKYDVPIIRNFWKETFVVAPGTTRKPLSEIMGR